MAASETLDLGGKVVLPGIIDAHTHFSENLGRDFEGYRTGSMAAAAGGVTTILDMPLNDLPPTTDRITLAKKRKMIEGQGTVDYAHWGALIDNNLAHIGEQHEDEVIAFKAFMRTVADFPRVDDGLLYAGLQRIAKCGNVLGVHAENENSHILSQGEAARGGAH